MACRPCRALANRQNRQATTRSLLPVGFPHPAGSRLRAEQPACPISTDRLLQVEITKPGGIPPPGFFLSCGKPNCGGDFKTDMQARLKHKPSTPNPELALDW